MRNLNQDITFWTTLKTFSGLTFEGPFNLMGRWEDQSELFKTITGEEIVSKAKVALDGVVSVGDYLFKGISEVADPTSLADAHEVMSYAEMTNLRNNSTERIAIL